MDSFAAGTCSCSCGCGCNCDCGGGDDSKLTVGVVLLLDSTLDRSCVGDVADRAAFRLPISVAAVVRGNAEWSYWEW